ncbi:MAG: arginine--tRNA ligase [Spirochaetaceae bacterium]|nr:arginine--tRNA ligase [Spirochaetaceae bacterium]
MADLKEQCRLLVANALNAFGNELGMEAVTTAEALVLETPPNPEMGDLGIPMFPFAKSFRQAPPAIAAKIVALVQAQEESVQVGSFAAVGPYVNVKLNKAAAISVVLEKIASQKASYGAYGEEGKKPLDGRRVMVEFSSPNTNKPLHLGHLRNDALGESISRILKAAGAEVFNVNIVNHRGVPICKSMLAYQKFHQENNETPESLGIKSDRFVGDCYVEFDKWNKADPSAEKLAQALLVNWEQGDEAVHKLWKQMNDWAIQGITQTYQRTGISFDKLYYESETYLKGREEILKGLEDGIFYKEEDGSVWVDLEEINLDKKVLLRKDGTALYMTQDIGTAIYRHGDWPFNQLVYVVGSEQQYHFKVLFYVLKKLGYQWADQLYHLSYGMVNLPEGKMKSREGTVVDADDLINSLRDGALEEIVAKGREEAVGDPSAVAEKIALGALHYYLLKATPTKDMLFNPKESLSFNGDTGPYLQYMGARICSILRKAQEIGLAPLAASEAASLLTHEAEWELIKVLEQYPKILVKAAQNLDPSQVAGYLYDVAKAFSRFYHDCPTLALAQENGQLAAARLFLATCTRQVLENGLDLILVPFLETM